MRSNRTGNAWTILKAFEVLIRIYANKTILAEQKCSTILHNVRHKFDCFLNSSCGKINFCFSGNENTLRHEKPSNNL